MMPRSVDQVTVNLRGLLEEFDERLDSREEPEVLTLTEKHGFVAQRDRFRKRLATVDTSNYKLIGLHDIAFNPYLLWAGAIAQNSEWDSAIISPLYPTFRVRPGYDPRYVNYVLHSAFLRARYDGISFGSVPRRRRASVADFLNLRVPQPPALAAQRRLATILDSARALRAKRLNALNELEALIESMFLNMFGDPITNPKEWPNHQLGDLIETMQYGPRFYNEAYVADGIRIARITDLNEFGELNFAAMPQLSVAEDDVQRFALRPGDVIFARSGATVGKVALYSKGDTPCIPGAYFIRLRFARSVVPEYAVSLLRMQSVQARIEVQSRQSAQQNFSGPGLRRIPMPLPPAHLQRTFVQRKLVFDQHRKIQKQALARTDELFEALEYAALRGEL